MFEVTSFSLAVREFEPGLQLVDVGDKHPAFQLGPNRVGKTFDLWLGSQEPNSIPIYRNMRLLSAELYRLQHRPSWRLVRPKDPEIRLLRITSRDLDFDTEPLLPDHHVYAGGEGKEPAAYWGKRNDAQFRDELYAFSEGEKMIASDTRGGIGLITLCGGTFELRPATTQEVTNFVFQYGLRAPRILDLKWAKSALYSLKRHDLIRLLAEREPALRVTGGTTVLDH